MSDAVAVAPIAARSKGERISKQNLELAVRVYVRFLESSAG